MQPTAICLSEALQCNCALERHKRLRESYRRNLRERRCGSSWPPEEPPAAAVTQCVTVSRLPALLNLSLIVCNSIAASLCAVRPRVSHRQCFYISRPIWLINARCSSVCAHARTHKQQLQTLNKPFDAEGRWNRERNCVAIKRDITRRCRKQTNWPPTDKKNRRLKIEGLAT